MRRTDQSVGPASWYSPTRYKLLVGLIIAVVVLILFIVVNPGSGSDGVVVMGAGSARAISLVIEKMPVPPFNLNRLVHVRCGLSADRKLASCVGTEKYIGPKSVPGVPVPSHPAIPGVHVSFVVRRGETLTPICSNHHPQNIFCAS